MKKYTMASLILMLAVSSSMAFAQNREITITIDDLPFVGSTHNKPGNLRREHERFMNMMNALIEYKVPATGFVISGTIEKDQWQLLQQFHDEGFVIGNHTHRHKNLNTSNAESYIEDIERTDKVLAPLMPGKKFFRYPYLAEGAGDKKEQVRRFLAENNYIIAPVTVDTKDFKFNAQILAIHWRSRPNHLERIKRNYLSYIWKQTLRAERIAENKYGKPMPQILLIHANYLNSHVMADIIELYKQNGYTFISLEKALNEYQRVETAAEREKMQENVIIDELI